MPRSRIPIYRYGYRGRARAARHIQGKYRSYKAKQARRRAGTSVKTGFLKVIQKVLTQETIPAGPHPTGYVQKRSYEISEIPQFSTYSVLFDQYRITGVKTTFLPTTNTNDVQNVGGTFIYSIDLDGDTTITTFDDILQCSNSHTSPWSTAGGMTPYKKVYCQPRNRDALVRDICNNVPTLSTTLGPRNAWIDLGDRGMTEHFGLITGWYFGNAQLNVAQELNVITTYYIEFRKVR